MLVQLFAVIEKNFRRLIRSKISALIILVGPLILIGVIGLAFSNSGMYGIVIGVYSDSYSNLTNSFIDNLASKEFSIHKYGFEDDCIESVRNGKSHICVTLPDEITPDKQIEFHVDYSRLNLAFTLLDVLTAKVSGTSKEISMGLVSELVNKMKYTIGTLENNSAVIEELKKNAEALGIKIIDIKQEVIGMNVNFNLSSLNFSSVKKDVATNKDMVSTYESTITSQISTNRAKLNQFRQQAVTLKEYVDEQRQKQDNIKANVDATYSQQNCASQTVVDLTPYLEDSEELSNQINSLTNPTCSFLYSIKKNVDDTGKQLDSTSKNLQTIISDIDDAKDELADFQNQTKSTFDQMEIGLVNAQQKFDTAETSVSDAEQRLAQLESSKAGFATELDSISTMVNLSIGKFDQINYVMGTMLTNIKNVTVASPEMIVSPISTRVKPLTASKKTLDYLFSSLVVLVVMFVSTLLSSSLVMKEKSSKASFRNLISPVKNYIFVVGTYLTALIITLIQITIIIGIAAFFFNINVAQNIGTVFIIVAIIITIFSGLGIIISNVFRSEETATIASIIMACILFLFSSTIVPIEKMSEAMGMLARINPFVMSELMLNKAFLFSAPLGGMKGDLTMLLLQLIIISGLAIYSFRAFKHGEQSS